MALSRELSNADNIIQYQFLSQNHQWRNTLKLIAFSLHNPHFKEIVMTKQSNHNADIRNPNKGSDGTNKTYDQNQGNKGWQLNPQNPSKGGGKK